MSNLILPVTEVETVDVPYDEMRRLAAAADVIEGWGLNLTCKRCASLFGVGHDQVMGDNEQGSTVLVVRCGCTVRRCETRGR